jgi:hypothetical protein
LNEVKVSSLKLSFIKLGSSSQINDSCIESRRISSFQNLLFIRLVRLDGRLLKICQHNKLSYENMRGWQLLMKPIHISSNPGMSQHFFCLHCSNNTASTSSDIAMVTRHNNSSLHFHGYVCFIVKKVFRTVL